MFEAIGKRLISDILRLFESVVSLFVIMGLFLVMVRVRCFYSV